MTEYLIALVELLEAEGRSLRRWTLEVGFTICLMLFSGLLVVAGLALAGWGLYQFLASAMSPPAAALVIGLVGLALGGGILWQLHRSIR